MKLCIVTLTNLHHLSGTAERIKNSIKAIKGETDYYFISRVSKKDEKTTIKNIFFLPFEILRSFVLLLKKKPTHIYAIQPEAGFCASIYKLLNRKACILYEAHSPFMAYNALFKLFEIIAYRSSDKMIVLSKLMKLFASNHINIEPKKIEVIYGPIDLKKIKYTLPVSKSILRICYAGSSYKYHGIEIMLEAAKICLQKGIKAEFYFIGLNNTGKYLNYQSEDIKIFGKLDEKKFMEILSSCDIFLSIYTGHFSITYPQKISTYLALGRPIISTKTADLEQIFLENKCGIIIDAETETLANAIATFSNMSYKSRVEMGKNARKFAEQNLSLDKIGGKLLKLLTQNCE